jgi:hypothetical protein
MVIKSYKPNKKSDENKGFRLAGWFFGITGFLALISSIVFLSKNVTGNIVQGIDKSSSGFFGVVLLLLGISFIILFLRLRNN